MARVLVRQRDALLERAVSHDLHAADCRAQDGDDFDAALKRVALSEISIKGITSTASVFYHIWRYVARARYSLL